MEQPRNSKEKINIIKLVQDGITLDNVNFKKIIQDGIIEEHVIFIKIIQGSKIQDKISFKKIIQDGRLNDKVTCIKMIPGSRIQGKINFIKPTQDGITKKQVNLIKMIQGITIQDKVNFTKMTKMVGSIQMKDVESNDKLVVNGLTVRNRFYNSAAIGHLANACPNEPCCSYCNITSHSRRDCKTFKQDQEKQEYGKYGPEIFEGRQENNSDAHSDSHSVCDNDTFFEDCKNDITNTVNVLIVASNCTRLGKTDANIMNASKIRCKF
ncbi:unnamed protein product [Mytilus coruscus]|uniref:CCHC-type domain-containing protein n=1 Tax=Mytilus coruscus TaxID=42192 RepID=A0A6J8B201_MYTCO|nr:unnamed protein product [Mytilus coruscus]